ncbi:hypothetical protein CL65_gp094 [Mycobacterium phage Patience]|uniref:Uncharacterized protein n=1 Tax=Mycobacterium phage Patience TaxID=1074308 RepID=G1JWL4_9CAUD|nr:hypothetical protein CL65_gp094 [Mycobacterium phage Patience]AEL98012.1 hypothetical protein PATIENCE_104 [Mycobacterium phage Patience]
MRANENFEQKEITSYMIGCSFCSKKVRKDVPDYDRDDYRAGSAVEKTRRDLQAQAIQDGWTVKSTNQGYKINLCPDHTKSLKEAGIQ